MKKRYALFLFLWITIVPCLNAQKKEIQQAEAIVKSGKNLDRAEQQMRKLLTDSVNRRNLKIWSTMTNAVRGQYLQGNERLYLHLKQEDTAALFKLAHKMFRDYQAMDSVDALPDKKGRIRIKYRSSHAAFLQTYRPNLYNGGVFFLRRHSYQEAFTLLDAFLDCQRQPLFENQHFEKDPLNRSRTACSIWPKSTGSNATNSSTSRPWWMVSSAIPTPPISSRGLLII